VSSFDSLLISTEKGISLFHGGKLKGRIFSIGLLSKHPKIEFLILWSCIGRRELYSHWAISSLIG
jgi:hypothetical protein